MSLKLSLSEALEQLCESQQELMQTLESADQHALYYRPSEEVWSLAQVLAHIAENRLFFIREVLKVVSTPGVAMGRTVQDAGRLARVRDFAGASAEFLKQDLIESQRQLLAGLEKLSVEDLETVGNHVKFGPQTVGELIEHFIVEHDQRHAQQARRCIVQANAVSKSGAQSA